MDELLQHFFGIKLRVNCQMSKKRWKTYTNMVLDATIKDNILTFTTTRPYPVKIEFRGTAATTFIGNLIDLINANMLFLRFDRFGLLVSNKFKDKNTCPRLPRNW